MIPPEARHLARLILASAQARGVRLEERFLRLERGLPVLRVRLGGRALRGCYVGLPGDPRVAHFGHAPDVITVHGSGHRSSRMWPRNREGTFKIEAIVDHLLHLIEVELSRPKPELAVTKGVPPGLSGLHVLHLAGVRLGVLPAGSKPGVLLEPLDQETRARIESHIARGNLIAADLRRMDLPNELHFGRSNRLDFDPFNMYSDRALQVLVLGRPMCSKVDRRFVLIIDDHDGTEFTVVDPAGDGLVQLARKDLEKVWQLGARRGVKWAGTIWVR